MRILLLSHAFNSLTQRLFVTLRERGHEVSVEFDINDAVTREAVDAFQPDLLIAPFLKRAIPEDVWRNHTCLIVHPGIRGDRGPSALDWAVLDGETHWGVTVLQAEAEMDAGPVWAWREFALRDATKSSLYRNEVSAAAVDAVIEALERFAAGDLVARRFEPGAGGVRGRARPLLRQAERAIDWSNDDTRTVLRKIRSADGAPGVRDELFGREVLLYDAHPERVLRGAPGSLIARSGDALCRATRDGAVWIGHLRDAHAEHPFKLPAARLFEALLGELPVVPGGEDSGYRDIWYEEANEVGYLHFAFYNGAMGTRQCERLREAYSAACARDTRVIVLMGGPDYWSNGMHLNLIEAAASPADESWRNINAIDDLAQAIIETDTHLTVAALQGNAGAGGVFLARAADEVWARAGVVLNPHYKDMGNLYGSEYWTYLLPRYAGDENVERITQGRLPMGVDEAQRLGLVNQVFASTGAGFVEDTRRRAAELAHVPAFADRLDAKRQRRAAEQRQQPLTAYREAELARMRLNFYGFDPSYHVARYNFVHKVAKSRTPLTIAQHRRLVSGHRGNA
ncbi:MAG: hydrogenase maturation protein [Chromatiaceae bacterium]|nr:hydrogenase maturation protein [Gammaproteobacteria bacterium]MCP5306591.1 hydrogenase maturation protein [Chromatiaceae bacterium]MCP5312143.1 hydrogenase maturation protein [Chromatiaceae bacterium]